jgi:hypothetical protein
MSFNQWFRKRVKFSHTGALSPFDVIECYREATGQQIDYETALRALSRRFEIRQDETTLDLLAKARIDDIENDDDYF